MIIFNLGCGTKTSPRCVNIDWSIYLRLKRNRLGSALALGMLKGDRLEKFKQLSSGVVVHDLRRGIPAAASSVDAVYHSHFLEHLSRERVPQFMAEIWRVLKPGGVQRIVVPDWERLCSEYLADVDSCNRGTSAQDRHEQKIAAMIDQMVRSEAHGTSQQKPVQRWLENFVLGDANRRGDLHRWMYDRFSLQSVLRQSQFVRIQILDHSSSSIPDWAGIGLDRGTDGSEYKPGSLYVEAFKP